MCEPSAMFTGLPPSAEWMDDEIEFLNQLLLTPPPSFNPHLLHSDVMATLEESELHLASPIASFHDHQGATKRPLHSSISPLDGQAKRSRVRTQPTLKSSLPAFKTLTSTQCLQHIHKSFGLLTKAKEDLKQKNYAQMQDSIMGLNGWHLCCPNATQIATLSPNTPPTYTLSKVFPKRSVQDLMHHTWQIWTDPMALMKMFPSKRYELQILQRFNGDGLIIQQDTASVVNPMGLPGDRSIYMLFRVETKQGFTVCARSLDSYSAHYSPTFHWITFCTTDDQSQVQVEFGSCVQPPHTVPASQQTLYQQSEALKLSIRSNLLALLQWETLIQHMPPHHHQHL
ncbi:hypothetical protein Poli38472_014182 [Pythium oligandrum]|uniref:Uncharacterized protein n=1 Tax=Pythium oligandrum TaxID=41045 RepID=A0A8K1FHM8_PYTOL|nr:hypothetical protein Poli38472_014182 [Pythium oligandrum]|eukprot:TMW64065.1 hypothetical protein Poli38472_014182 [Pythium oligandrum]